VRLAGAPGTASRAEGALRVADHWGSCQIGTCKCLELHDRQPRRFIVSPNVLSEEPLYTLSILNFNNFIRPNLGRTLSKPTEMPENAGPALNTGHSHEDCPILGQLDVRVGGAGPLLDCFLETNACFLLRWGFDLERAEKSVEDFAGTVARVATSFADDHRQVEFG
jgi:hypothetical protein